MKRWLLLIGIAVVGFVADWVSKAWVLANFQVGDVRPVLGDLLQWTLVYNPGSLFSLDPSRWIPDFPTNAFLIAFNGIALVALIVFYAKIDPKERRLTSWGLAIVVPGALGNVFDRIMGRPGVVDFIRMDLGFAPFHPWPTYNVADVFISVGIAFLFLDMILDMVRTSRKPAGAAADGSKSSRKKGGR